MAVTPGVGTATAEQLISVGGNIYALMAAEPVKVGFATRGRGFWVGKERKDQQNPDVDSPLADGLDVNVKEGAIDNPDDGFDDNKDAMLAYANRRHMRGVYQASRKYGRDLARQSARAFGNAVGDMGPQPVFVAKGVKMDLLLQNPENLSKADLIESATKVKALMENGGLDFEEQRLVRGYAGRLAHAMRELAEAEFNVAKAILTKPQAERDKEVQKKKAAKKPPEKAQAVKTDETGKKQYKYAKKDDAKGPQSAGAGSSTASSPDTASVGSHAEPAAAPPPPIDVASFAKRLGVPVFQIEKLVQKKTRVQFVDFFMRHDDLVDKHGINAAFLGRLYDFLTVPQQPPPAMDKSAAAYVLPEQFLKSVVAFQGATLDQQTLALIDFMKSHRARTVGDVVACVEQHYCTTHDMALRTTRTLLRKWEQEGLISFYPPKE